MDIDRIGLQLIRGVAFAQQGSGGAGAGDEIDSRPFRADNTADCPATAARESVPAPLLFLVTGFFFFGLEVTFFGAERLDAAFLANKAFDFTLPRRLPRTDFFCALGAAMRWALNIDISMFTALDSKVECSLTLSGLLDPVSSATRTAQGHGKVAAVIKQASDSAIGAATRRSDFRGPVY